MSEFMQPLLIGMDGILAEIIACKTAEIDSLGLCTWGYRTIEEIGRMGDQPEFVLTPERREVIEQQLARFEPMLRSLEQQRVQHQAEVDYHSGFITRIDYAIVKLQEEHAQYEMELQLDTVINAVDEVNVALVDVAAQLGKMLETKPAEEIHESEPAKD